jgi:ankyrin repeat protein
LPYRTEHTEQYVNTVVNDITPSTVEYLLNAFTSSNATRKHFRDLFSMQPHWLLQYIIHTTPAMIFGLVNRNEKELLVPFLKLHKQSLLQLRDEKGNTLLHEAAMSRSLTENTIQLLRNAGFSLQALNQEGLTPAALAEKHKRTEKMKWLK